MNKKTLDKSAWKDFLTGKWTSGQFWIFRFCNHDNNSCCNYTHLWLTWIFIQFKNKQQIKNVTGIWTWLVRWSNFDKSKCSIKDFTAYKPSSFPVEILIILVRYLNLRWKRQISQNYEIIVFLKLTLVQPSSAKA